MVAVKQNVKKEKKKNKLKKQHLVAKLLLDSASSSFCATQANNMHKLLQAVT